MIRKVKNTLYIFQDKNLKIFSVGSHWIYIHLVGQVLPILYYLSMANLAAVVMIPTTGRSYNSTNPEYEIGILSGLICYITFGFIVSLKLFHLS